MKGIEICDKFLNVPILQGGMGVGISMSNLAGAVALQGGMGTISTACAGYKEDDYLKNPQEADMRALTKYIQTAKEIANGNGMVAINAMVATTRYAQSVQTAIKAGVDAVVCGAGLPLTLPSIVGDAKVAIAPIVSSARAATLICKTWWKRYAKLPDFIVVEGSKAGGHLGFDADAIINKTVPSLEHIITEVVQAVESFIPLVGRAIPVFGAGGVYTGGDIKKIVDAGGAGGQIATRFIATPECDATQGYKDVIISACEDDAVIIKSPVGMPGRAVNTQLVQKIAKSNLQENKSCVNCITTCSPAKTPFCISNALIAAAKGDVENGLFFCGSNVGLINKMSSVKDIMDSLKTQWEAAK